MPTTPPSPPSDPSVADPPHDEALARAREKIDAVVRLAGGVAHDFNNLLTVVGGNSQFLLDELGNDNPYRAEISEIAEAARRAAMLTHQLLAFSRQLVLQPRLVDLRDVLDSRWESFVGIAGDGVRLHRDVDTALGAVLVDALLVDQALTHLVRNAADAVGRRGTIEIALVNASVDEAFAATHRPMTPGEYVLLRVRDDGAGMSPATLARVFEPFFSTKGQKHGTGMGLPTVYGIVKQSGGYIWIESVSGQGTNAQVYLPRAASIPVPLRPRTPARPAPPPGEEMILVVEDEDLVRILTRRTLERAGYRVVEAPNAQVALDLVRTHGMHPDLLLSDIVMPGMNGRELAATLDREFPGLAVVLMSGFVDQKDSRGTLGGGRWQFLPKPFSLEELRTRVREALEVERV
ncbi:MAG: response regulator [Gemmatimonadaceae bacterium]